MFIESCRDSDAWKQMQTLFVLGVDVIGDMYLSCDKQTILTMEMKHVIAMEQYMI